MSSSPSKRPYDQESVESNATGKRQKSTCHYAQDQPPKVSSDGIVFRLVCPSSKIGRITAENGSFVSQISEETGIEVIIEESIPGCDERIVVMKGWKKETESNTQRRQENGVDEGDKPVEEVENRNEHDGHDRDRKSDNAVVSKSEMNTSSVRKALLLVFERIVESEPENDGVDAENDKLSSFVLRLLVFSSQVGCLLGKGGSVIKQMSGESGAQIRILPRDKLPSCALASEEIVQITGEVDAVRKALHSVSQKLLENRPRDHNSFPTNHTGPLLNPSILPVRNSEANRESNHSFSSQRLPGVTGTRDITDCSTLVPKFREGGIPSRTMPSPEMLSFRLLCPDERVGGIIGKGGAIIKTLQHDTGCEIRIPDGISDSQDRLIVISGPAHPDDRISPVQDAVLRVQARIVRALPDTKEKNVTARLLISSNQIGCLLGKGGSVIGEMRKFTGAHIRIGNDQIPKGVSEGEMVQINGEYEAVQEALLQITTRLRHHFFRDVFPSVHHPFNPAFLDAGAPFSPYMERREFSPPGPYSNFGPLFHQFDRLGGPPFHDGFFPHDDRPPFMHNTRPGIPLHVSERRLWGPQGLIEDGGPVGLADFAGGPHRIPGFGGGSQPAIITSTTVEVVVPSSLVPVICGEDGACLKQIRQISDAKVTITDPKPGAAETVIIISGTPEQTHAAQSLIQAFVMYETEAS